MKIRVVVLIYLIVIFGCKDELILESGSYEEIMVVNGMISNQPGPYTVSLSLSMPINSDQLSPLEGYTVIIHENTGESETLTEEEPGKYVTSVDGMQGKIGCEYSISIISPSGIKYSSAFQELKETVEIESIYAKIDTIITDDYPFKVPGFQFYTDSELARSPENYFLWDIIETYEYDSDYEFYAYEYSDTQIFFSNSYLERLRTCWKTQKVKYFYTGNTATLEIPKINGQPLHFVSTATKKLSKKYSVLLNQYCINKEAYQYWKSLEDLLSNENFLAVTQPYNAQGNIRCVSNPQEKTFGYFTVASVSQKRIFLERPNLEFYYSICSVITNGVDIEYFKTTIDPPYYWVYADEGEGLVLSKDCIDCTSEGGSIVVPEFWEY